MSPIQVLRVKMWTCHFGGDTIPPITVCICILMHRKYPTGTCDLHLWGMVLLDNVVHSWLVAEHLKNTEKYKEIRCETHLLTSPCFSGTIGEGGLFPGAVLLGHLHASLCSLPSYSDHRCTGPPIPHSLTVDG